MKHQTRENILYRLLMAMFFIMFCACVAFTARLLQANGFNYAQTANAMLISSVFGFIMQFLWGALNDRGLSPKIILTIAGLISIVAYYFLTHYGQSHAVSIASLIAASIGITSMMPLVDAWGVKLISQGVPIIYPKARSVGSLTYALTAILFGLLLDAMGIRVTPWLLLFTFVPMFIIILLLPSPKRIKHDEEKLGLAKAAAILLKHPTYKHYAAAMFVAGIGVAAQLLFYPVFMLELGASNTQIGVGFAVMAFMEVLVMPFYGRLKARFGVRKIYIFSVFGHGARVLLVALAVNPIMGIAGMTTQAIAGALIFPSMTAYVSDEIDRRVISTAQVLLNATFFTLSGVLSNLISGPMAMAVGVRYTLIAAGVTPIVAGVYLMVMTGKSKRAGE